MSRFPPLQFRREDIPDLSTGERTDRLLRGLNQFGSAIEPAMNKGLTFAAHMNAFAKEIRFAMEAEWVTLTPVAPWTGSPQVRKIGRRVDLRGGLTVNAAASGSLAVTLGADYVPAVAWSQPIATTGAFGGHAAITGASVAIHFGAGVTAVVLDGVGWDAADVGTNGAFPIRVKNELSVPPTHVWVTRLVDVTTSGREKPIAPGGVAWSVSKDQILIADVGNVFAGRTYRATILAVAE